MLYEVITFCKLDFAKYQGGSFQIELTPNFFKAGTDAALLMDAFSQNFFRKGGVQINFNLVDLSVLEDAMNHPENLKLSVHSGSDKFSIYPIMGELIQKHGKGIHVKTAGTTWLEEVIGLAMAGGDRNNFV